MPDTAHNLSQHAGDPISIAHALAQRLGASAVERDQAGGHAAREREWIRASGLLTLSIPTEFGGQGADWPTVMQVVRILARADSALAHVFGFHHLQLAGIALYGSAQQQRALLTDTVARNLFWGNALNPLDTRTTARANGDGFLIDGVKSFASGSVGSDWLTISAWNDSAGAALIGVVPTNQQGITVQADWDAFGQRQTDSGNVYFCQVPLRAEHVLQTPAQPVTARSTLRSQVAQLIMANLYLGIGQGAFEAARDYTCTQSRAWFASGVDAASADPLIEHRYGELWLTLRPAEVLAEHAAVLLEQAFGQGAQLTARARRGGCRGGRGEGAGAPGRPGCEQPDVRADGCARHLGALRLRPFLAQRARAHPARPDRLQAARPRALRARRPRP